MSSSCLHTAQSRSGTITKDTATYWKPRAPGNELHPTQKPVEILEKLLDNTQWAEGVLDTFGGSGTTLIAAESVGQQAFLMEMEPAFVDTIVRRYIRTTRENNRDPAHKKKDPSSPARYSRGYLSK